MGRDVSNDGYHLLSGRFVLLLLGYGLLYRGTGTIVDIAVTIQVDLKLTSSLHYHNLTTYL